MLSFARRRVSALFEGLLASIVIATLAALLGIAAFTLAVQWTPPGQETREGILSIRHGDDFTGGRVTGPFYFLMSGAGETELAFEGAAPDPSADGAQIRVHGVNQGGRFLVAAGGSQQGSGPSTSTSPATGSKRVAVVLLNFSNDPSEPYTPEFASGVAFTNTNSVAAYYAETSDGQLTLSGDVFGWYTIPETNTTCGTSTWASAATLMATAAGVDLSSYDNVVYAFPTAASCPWGGLAQLPGRSSWLNGTGAMGLRIMAHELGHNFGTHHASTLNCIEAGVRVSLSATSANCTPNEYGDPFTVMGQASQYEHTNFSRGNFGWLASGNTVTVTDPGEYVLQPVESGDASALRAVQVLQGPNTFLTLEFRQPIGVFDTFSGTMPVATGVSIRMTSYFTARRQSQLIDSTPATASFSDAPLQAGTTLTDPLSGISITTLSTSSSGATVRIAFGTGVAPSPTPAPTATASPMPSPTPAPSATPGPTTGPTSTPSPTPSADVRPPTAPTDLRATVGKGRKFQLTWSPSSDDVGVAGYRVYLNGAQVMTTPSTTFDGTVAGKRVVASYWIVAYDLAGNLSASSLPVQVAAP